MPSQVRALALGCAADLMKAEEAQRAAADSPDFLPTVLDALQARPTLPYPTPTPPAPLCLARHTSFHILCYHFWLYAHP